MSNLPEPESAPANFDSDGQASTLSDEEKVVFLLSEIEEGEYEVQQLRTELSEKEHSMQLLCSHLSEMEQKNDNLIKQLEKLHQRIGTSNCSDAIEELTIKLKLLKVLENEESDLQSVYGKKCADLQSEMEHEKLLPLSEGCHDSVNSSPSLSDLLDRLHLAKKELGAKLQAVLSLKRQYDAVPAQTELIQYERRVSELYSQIQEKHRQTRKHYDTYNALLDIKDLMLKETSLLNSIDSQFQDAMSSTIGRSKLVDSMEVIVKGSKQKLEKAQLALLAEQRICNSLKEKHASAVGEQRYFSSLLKAFQEECTRNEKLRKLSSV
ncbi:uncharacterized protein A4U43_C01F19900 [Asparagus officinalis]|uniref:CCDC93 coiled-coil domain-containing protein n=1 Tax=Asparagus officinalis TaxID=4686 RepID=A0A5P1FSH4_ASPOF|nr:coiled-coil domain-containing protein 93 [Asparagus officinalis]ONK80623.1 uncharacterized protein A4U43_C01F19900 [Asparagus officinalis]